jgi:hypothetical protein
VIPAARGVGRAGWKRRAEQSGPPTFTQEETEARRSSSAVWGRAGAAGAALPPPPPPGLLPVLGSHPSVECLPREFADCFPACVLNISGSVGVDSDSGCPTSIYRPSAQGVHRVA